LCGNCALGDTCRKSPTPVEQLKGFLNQYKPRVAKIARGALAHLRRRWPGAFELVYDNYNALAIAWCGRRGWGVGVGGTARAGTGARAEAAHHQGGGCEEAAAAGGAGGLIGPSAIAILAIAILLSCVDVGDGRR
jgi:hypothetical protein